MSDEISFGRWLQRRRKALDLTQEALALRVGCAAETLRKIEADARRPSRQIAERLADALELPATEHALFIKVARAELNVDRLAPPTRSVDQVTLLPTASLPQGTVTFLFTDIESSTQLWEQYPQVMADALARHDGLLRQVITAHGGVVFKSTGDGLAAAFPRAADALGAALTAQRALHAEEWGVPGSLRVRMALHTGAAEERDGDYFGPPVNRVARLTAAAHGGQILLSRATQELIRDHLPAGAELRDLADHALKGLSRPEQIFQLVVPDLPADFPPLATLATRRGNLLAQPTHLIGRDREVATVCTLLRTPEVRLLTLSGPGGIGKTRLALQVGADLLDAFPDGVYFVDLAPIHDPDLVITAIAQTLDVRESEVQSPLDQLKGYLREKQPLLLLDNFEQVIAAAPAVADLLAACPRLKVLVTSREVLHLRGEKEFAVPPLALPNPKKLPPLEDLSQYAAVELFIARALDVRPDFAVTNENAPAVAKICHRLDGLPLAIELATARIKLFAPQALLVRLEQRLALLTGGARDLPARQQTLRNTIDWSYNLLDVDEQLLFRRLAVFVGGCTMEAAESVCNGAGDLRLVLLDGLASLVAKSLLRQVEGVDGEPRFSMLETIREYAFERLNQSGEAEVQRRCHAQFFLALAEAAEPRLRGQEQEIWLARLEAEHSNLRAALAWCQEAADGAQAGLRLAGALGRFWEIRGHRNEARAWLQSVLARPEAAQPTVARAKALHEAGYMAQFGEIALFEESLTLARALGVNEICAQVLYSLGWCTYFRGDAARGMALLEESLALYQELGDRWGTAEALRDLAEVVRDRGDLQQSAALLEESLTISQELGDKRGMAETLCDIGRVARDQDDLARAAAWYEQSLPLARHLKDKRISARAIRGLGKVARDQGDLARAAALSEQSLNLARDVGDLEGIADALCDLAEVALQQGERTRAQALFQEALSLYRAAEHHLDVAWVLVDLGRMAHLRGDDTEALADFAESLSRFREWGHMGGITCCLDALAGIVGAQGKLERAMRLLAAAEALRDARGVQLSTADRAEWERNLALARAQLGETAFAAAWAEGHAMPLENAIAEAIDRSV